jgi:hypothetical protein
LQLLPVFSLLRDEGTSLLFMFYHKKAVATLPPPPDTGIHSAVMRNARRLLNAGFTQESAVHALEQWANFYPFRRPVTAKEISEAISKAYRTPSQGLFAKAPLNLPCSPKWPAPNPEKRAKLIDEDFHLVTLWEKSPYTHSSNGAPLTKLILDRLFPDNPLLCLGWDARKFDTRPLREWEKPEQLQFVVPSPMSARTGRKKDGSGESAHTLANTGPKRFLVVDFDDRAGLDVHAGAAWYLGTLLPLALVVWTGGKGLHAWFYVAGKSDEELRPFFSLACEFGGDSRLWLRSQFARVPDGIRDNGETQTAFYFNPEVCA